MDMIQAILDCFPDMVSEFGIIGCTLFSAWLVAFLFSAFHAFLTIGKAVWNFFGDFFAEA